MCNRHFRRFIFLLYFQEDFQKKKDFSESIENYLKMYTNAQLFHLAAVIYILLNREELGDYEEDRL